MLLLLFSGAAGGSVTGAATTSQAQTVAAAGAFNLSGVFGDSATSQAQTIAASGSSIPPAVTGTGATSQAQTASGSGTYTPAAITGIGATSQAQTAAGTGTFTGSGITGTGATSQGQTSSGAGNVTSPNILTGGGEYLRHKLIHQFEDDQRRVEALSKLPAIKPAERLAVKRAAHKLATSIEPFTFDDVADEINASLRETDAKGQESHLDWVLYFLRVEAYTIEKQAQEAEELEIIAAMMMARKQWQL